MIRKRDVAAVLFVVALSHLVWNQQESLSASVRLAFYVGRSTFLVPMDMDGDGETESLVQLITQDSLSQQQNPFWKFKVLSLPPQSTSTRPQIPKTLLESSFSLEAVHISAVSPPLEPLHMTTGHVLIRSKQQKDKQPSNRYADSTTSQAQQQQQQQQSSDRTRHYYCGTDWHHAAQSCQKHCPSGKSSECRDGQRCFADTPCDSLQSETYNQNNNKQSSSDEQTMESRLMDARNVTTTYALSPVGGLPSVMLLWSNAILTLHSWTALRSAAGQQASQPQPALQFESMWTLNLIPELHTQFSILHWGESTLQFVDAVDAGNDSGLLLVTATIIVISQQNPLGRLLEAHLVVAVHARTGQVLWREFDVQDDTMEAEGSIRNSPLVLLNTTTTRRASSIARRRSLIPNLHSSSSSSLEYTLPEQHCMESYFRRPLLTATSSLPGQAALPFLYTSKEDASTRVLHFDLEQPVAHAQKNDKKNKNKKNHPSHRHSQSAILHGRPNVVVMHQQQGLQVRSLKNGRTLCQLSLNENALYADVNHDGTLDSVQLALGTHALKDPSSQQENADDDVRFITQLAQRVADGQALKKKTKMDVAAPLQQTSLCHLVVLSGFPNREELFSSHLCSGYLSPTNQQELRGTSPLLMEPMDGRKGWDIVVAINSGVVNRIHGASGHQLWKLKGRRSEHLLNGASFPHWNDPTMALLSRVDAIQTVPSTRPVLLAGENSLVLLSATKGAVMASAAFPQPSNRRPILVDFDGDGTTDVLIHSKDAVWGYKIRVRNGSSVLLRIITGLLFMGILLAFIRNRFGPHPGKRSTDALPAPKR